MGVASFSFLAFGTCTSTLTVRTAYYIFFLQTGLQESATWRETLRSWRTRDVASRREN